MEVNQKILSQVLGISTRRVRQLREEGLFPFIQNTKKYSLEKCVQEYIDYKVNAETANGTSVSREKEQAEHERIKKNISALKLRKLKNEVHEAADVEMYWNEMLINFRNRLLALPAKLAPQIVGENDMQVILKYLTDEIHGTLDELAEYNPDELCRNDVFGDEELEEDENGEEIMEHGTN